MNQLPNFKIEQISKELNEIESDIAKNHENMTDEEIRFLVDSRRHLLALLNREIKAQKTNAVDDLPKCYAPKPEITRFIDSWCNKIKTSNIKNISYKCPDFCDLLFDHVLPKTWNFNEDLIVIHQPESSKILEVLKRRQQKHFIIYVTLDTLPPDVIAYVKLNDTPVCFNTEHLARTVSILQIPAQLVITVSCESNSSTAHETKEAMIDAVNRGKRTRIENTVTGSRFGKPWAINILKNMSNLQNSKNLHQLSVSGVDDAIIVASGPSLNKNVEKLREVQDSVFIVTALRSLPVLNAAGIEPDLVIQLDAESNEVAEKLSPDTSHPVKNLLLEGTVNNGFFAVPAKNTIWSLSQHFFDIHQKFGTEPTPFNVPSVSIYGLFLCQFLKFKNICFIGQDLAASSDKQYADGATDLLPAHSDMSMFKIEVPAFFGGTVFTRSSYEYQIRRCSEIARDWQAQQLDLNLVNATEGGAYIPEFDHMTLDAFIDQRALKSKQTSKSVFFSQGFHITEDGANSYLQSVYSTMTSISNLADRIIKLDKQTAKTAGLNKKLKKEIQKFQEYNDKTSLLQLAMQDSIAKVIGTSRETTTVDSYTQFFEKVKDTAMLLKDAAKR